MNEKFVKSVKKNGDSLAINIPVEIVRLLGIEEKDILRVEIEKVKRK
tara:strand:- start:2771 stop:2911 length:141 start_codon:yes stop_codon:yes gene_type:complete